MPPLHARAGVAIAGVISAGWTTPNVKVFIGGVDRTDNVDGGGSFRIMRSLDGAASSCQLVVNGFVPVQWQRVLITYTTPDQYMFSGTILAIQVAPNGRAADGLLWQCTAVGDTWLLDTFGPVFKRYIDRGVSTIVGDILSTTGGVFGLGFIPSSLGNLSMEFGLNEMPSAAIDRVAKAKDAYWDIMPSGCPGGPSRLVSVYTDYPEAPVFPIGNTTEIAVAGYTSDGSQVRTRELFQGKSTKTSAPVGTGATVVPVTDIGIFPNSGKAVAGFSILTYTGRSATAGAGSLTGVTGLTEDLAEGDDVAIFVQHDDAPAQAALAALLGVGSGIVTHTQSADDATATESSERASADVDLFKSAMTELVYSSVSETHRHVDVGRKQTVNLTLPLTVSDTFRVQSLTIVRKAATKGGVVNLERQVSLTRWRRSLTQILRGGL